MSGKKDEQGPRGYRLWRAEVERLMPLHRNAEGVMDDGAIVTGLAAFFRAHTDALIDAESWASEKLAQYQASRGMFKAGKGGASQMSMRFYGPDGQLLPNLDAIVQLGDNSSILLGDARRSQLTKRENLLKDMLHTQSFAINREINVLRLALGRMKGAEDTFRDVMGKDYGEDTE